MRIIRACPSSVLAESCAALASSAARPSWKMALIPWKKKQSTTQTALWKGSTLRKRVRNQERETEDREDRSGTCSASSGRRSLISSSNTDWSTWAPVGVEHGEVCLCASESYPCFSCVLLGCCSWVPPLDGSKCAVTPTYVHNVFFFAVQLATMCCKKN